MLCGDQGYRYLFRETDRLPPVEFIHGGNACAVDKATVAEGCYGPLNPSPCEALQGGKVQMIIVIVGNKDCIDGGQVFKTDAGVPVTLRAGP